MEFLRTSFNCSSLMSGNKDGNVARNGRQCKAPAIATCRTSIGSNISSNPCGRASIRD